MNDTLSSQYNEMYLEFLRVRIAMMEQLVSVEGFVKMVLLDYMKTGILKLAFELCNILHKQLFGSVKFKSYESFLRML